MIFDGEYDRSLWFALAGDRKNRDVIAELVYNIPSEIFEQIHHELKKYSESEESRNSEWKKFKKMIRTLEGENYFFSVEMNFEEINIKLCKWGIDALGLEENVELTLVPISMDDLLVIHPDCPRYVGSCSYRSSRVSPFGGAVIVMGNDKEYYLTSKYNNGVVMRNAEDSSFFKLVSYSKIPDDISLSDLGNRSNLNKLVRSRKR